MKNYIQHNPKTKKLQLRSKSKSKSKLKLFNVNSSRISSEFFEEQTSMSSQFIINPITSNKLINKKYYQAAITQYQKFNASSITNYLKGQHHNDYLNLTQIIKFYTPKQHLLKYEKISAEQKLKYFLKNSHEENKLRFKCLHFYGICYYILKHRQRQNKSIQKSLKISKHQKKRDFQHPNLLTKLKKKQSIFHSEKSKSRQKHILSTDTLELQKLSKYLSAMFKKNSTNSNHTKKNQKIDQLFEQTAQTEERQNKDKLNKQKSKIATSVNQFKQIMEQQFSQISLKNNNQYQSDCQIYGLSQLKNKKNKNKEKIDLDTKLDKNTSDTRTRTSKRFSANFQVQLSKIITTSKKELKSKSQSKNQSRKKISSKSSQKCSNNIKRDTNSKQKSKDKHTNFGQDWSNNKKTGQKKYDKLTDTQRLLFHTDKLISKQKKIADCSYQDKINLKKVKSQKGIKISIKKKVK